VSRGGYHGIVPVMGRVTINCSQSQFSCKIISDRQKKYTEDFLTTVKQEIQSSANKGDNGIV